MITSSPNHVEPFFSQTLVSLRIYYQSLVELVLTMPNRTNYHQPCPRSGWGWDGGSLLGPTSEFLIASVFQTFHHLQMHNPIPPKGGHTKQKTPHLHVLGEVEGLGGPPQVGGQRLLQLFHRGLDGQSS